MQVLGKWTFLMSEILMYAFKEVGEGYGFTHAAYGWVLRVRKGSTSFGACEVRCWRWLFGNTIPVSLIDQRLIHEIPR